MAVLVSLRNHSSTQALFLLLVCLLLTTASSVRLSSPQTVKLPENPAEVQITGTVADWPSTGKFTNRFPVNHVQLRIDDSLTTAAGAMVVTTIPVDSLFPGDSFACIGNVDFPEDMRNPGGFDETKYLKRYRASFSFRCDENTSRTLSDQHSLSSRFTGPLRSSVRTRLKKNISDSTHLPLFQALILGDRSGLDDSTRRQFQVTGLMHVLAVSGLHVMLVAMLTYGILRQILLRLRASWILTEWTRLILSTMLLATYCLISGGSPSILRASVMAFVFMSSNVVGRLPSSINSLCIAGLIILLTDPLQLFQAGFQLSFAAVLSIVTIMPRLGTLQGRLKYLHGSVMVTLAATLGTAPVLLKHFGSFSLSGFILNPLAIPLTALSLLAGIAASISAHTIAGNVFGASASLFADLLLRLTEWGERYVRFELFADYFADTTWIIIALLALSIARWHKSTERRKFLKTFVAASTAAIFLNLGLKKHEPGLDVIFIDVGQGDAALIRTPCGQNYLVDTGPGTVEYSGAARSIYQVIRSMGIRSIDTVFISHPHSDHIGGLHELIEMVPVENVVTNGRNYDSGLFAHTINAIKDRQIGLITTGTASQKLHKQGCVGMRLLDTHENYDTNDASLILRLDYGDTSFLFTGDSEKSAENSLVKKYGLLLSTSVIKVAHHGSETSSTTEFVFASTYDQKDGLAVISSGRNNRFGHPDSNIVRRWKESGYEVLNTANHGAVWIHSDGRSLSKIDWKK